MLIRETADITECVGTRSTSATSAQSNGAVSLASFELRADDYNTTRARSTCMRYLTMPTEAFCSYKPVTFFLVNVCDSVID